MSRPIVPRLRAGRPGNHGSIPVREIKLNSQLHPVSKLRMNGAMSPLPHVPSWHAHGGLYLDVTLCIIHGISLPFGQEPYNTFSRVSSTANSAEMRTAFVRNVRAQRCLCSLYFFAKFPVGT